MIQLSSRHLGPLVSVVLLALVAVVYLIKPQVDLAPSASARLQNAPVYRVVSDPADLLRYANADGPAPGVVSDALLSRQSGDGPLDGAVPTNIEQAGQSALDNGVHQPTQVMQAPLSAQLAPPAQPGTTSQPGSSSLPIAPAQGPSASGVSDPAIEELKDLGMATVAGKGDWYTLQTAYVPADDLNTLKMRVLEVSAALGSRDGLFIYQATKGGATFYGLCVRRFSTGASAKAFKVQLDRKLGYSSQLRSKKGLQRELGF